MKRLSLLAVVLVVAACGGAGNSIPAENPFMGQWVGRTPANEDVSFEIAKDGAMTLYRDADTWTGSINEAGAFTCPPASGSATKNGNGLMVTADLGGGPTTFEMFPPAPPKTNR